MLKTYRKPLGRAAFAAFLLFQVSGCQTDPPGRYDTKLHKVLVVSGKEEARCVSERIKDMSPVGIELGKGRSGVSADAMLHGARGDKAVCERALQCYGSVTPEEQGLFLELCTVKRMKERMVLVSHF